MTPTVDWLNAQGTLVRVIDDQGEHTLPPDPALPLWRQVLGLLAAGEIILAPYEPPQPPSEEP